MTSRDRCCSLQLERRDTKLGAFEIVRGAPQARMKVSTMHCAHDPLYDIHPLTGISIEVFFADLTLETFGRGGAGWFWWSRRRGFSPNGLATGPFSTSYAAYRHAMNNGGAGTKRNAKI
jgi:hypothetical protein